MDHFYCKLSMFSFDAQFETICSKKNAIYPNFGILIEKVCKDFICLNWQSNCVWDCRCVTSNKFIVVFQVVIILWLWRPFSTLHVSSRELFLHGRYIEKGERTWTICSHLAKVCLSKSIVLKFSRVNVFSSLIQRIMTSRI